MTPAYPTMQRLARASPEQLWEWYAHLPKPATPGERQVLVETMRRLNLIPGAGSPGSPRTALPRPPLRPARSAP